MGRIRVALGLAALAAGVASLVVTLTSGHVDHPGLAAALNLLIGWSFVGSGLLAWSRRPDNRTGPLMVAMGLTWLLGTFQAADSSALFTIGLLFNSLSLAIFVHLILAFPEGRLHSGAARAVALAAYLDATVAQLVAILFFDPSSPRFDCQGCPANDLLVTRNDDVTHAVFTLQNAVAVAITLAVIVLLVRRWRVATAPARRVLAPVYLTAAVTLLIGTFLFASSLVWPTAQGPLRWATFCALSTVPLAFLIGLLYSRLARTGVSQLLVDLATGGTPGRLREALARALGDPSLWVAYWLPESESYVDVRGRPVELPGADSRQVATLLERDGRRIGALVHDVTLADQRELVDAVCAAAGLALQNERLQAELRARLDQLSESEERLHALIEASPLAIVEIDLDARVTFWNRAAESLYGWTSEEVIGQEVSFVPREEVQEVDEIRARLLRGDAIRGVETSRLRKDGSLVEVALSAGPVYDGTGTIVRYMAVSADISERKRALRELAASEERLRALFEASPVAIIELDLEGRVTRWNEAAERMFGWRSEEVVGRPVPMIPPDRASESADFQARVRRGESLVSVQTKRMRKDGSLIDVELSAAPVRDGAGNVVSLMSVNVDITKRVRAEGELRRERDFISTLIESAPVLVVVFDREGRFLRFNRECERLTGYSFEEVEGRHFWDLFILPEEADRIRRSLARVWAGEFPSMNENYWLTRTGGRRLILWSNNALLDEDGNVEYIVSAGIDITDRKRAEQEVRASRARIVEAGDAERRRLERNLHDGAQQRLVALSLGLRLAHSNVASDHGAAEQFLASASEELAQALTELRELARGIHPAILTDRGLPAALEALAGRARTPVEVEIALDERLPSPIEAAAYYVVSEALTNVAKYARATEVTVSVARADGYALVEVADDGVGGADPTKGSGLRGLTDRVEALDGLLEVFSPPGEGTRIRVRIPVEYAERR